MDTALVALTELRVIKTMAKDVNIQYAVTLNDSLVGTYFETLEDSLEYIRESFNSDSSPKMVWLLSNFKRHLEHYTY
jgi:hypothetical protein